MEADHACHTYPPTPPRGWEMKGLMPGPPSTPSLADHYDPDLGSGRLDKVQPSPVMPGPCPAPKLFQDTKWTPSNTSFLFSPLSALYWS